MKTKEEWTIATPDHETIDEGLVFETKEEAMAYLKRYIWMAAKTFGQRVELFENQWIVLKRDECA